jgi:hypothetical protein
MDYKKIEEEQRQKEEEVRLKNEERRKLLAEQIKAHQESYEKLGYNRSTKEVQKKEMMEKEIEMLKEEHKRTYHSKMKSYGDSIKQKFGPVTSRKKQEEIRRRRQSLEMPPQEKYKNKPLLSDPEERVKVYKERIKVYKSLPRKVTHTPQPPRLAASIDYLQEFRDQRVIDDKASTDHGVKNIGLVDWRSDIKKRSLDSRYKEQRVTVKANTLKNEALYLEKLIKIKKNDVPIEDIENINDLLFESLEAKLSLLNGFHQPEHPEQHKEIDKPNVK